MIGDGAGWGKKKCPMQDGLCGTTERTKGTGGKAIKCVSCVCRVCVGDIGFWAGAMAAYLSSRDDFFYIIFVSMYMCVSVYWMGGGLFST